MWCRYDTTIPPLGRYHGGMESAKRITLRLPEDLHDRLTDRAQEDRRSLNSEIVHLLETALDLEGPAQPQS